MSAPALPSHPGQADLFLTLNRFPAAAQGDWRHTERLGGEAEVGGRLSGGRAGQLERLVW